MNLLDFAVTPLWLVWDTVRELAAEDGVELAESELIGLAPLAAFLAVADHAGAAPDGSGRSAARGGRRHTCGCATSRRCRRSSSASRPPRTAPPVTGGPFRVIEGGRGDEPSPGPPDRRRGRDRHDGGRASRRARARATSAASFAPASARGSGRADDAGRRRAGRAGSPPSDRGPRSRRRSRPRATPSAGSPGSTPPAGRSRRASSTRTPISCSRGTREGELLLRQRGAGYLEILAAGGGILSTVAATRASSDEELAAHGRRWLDEMLGHGVTTIEAKSGYGLDLADRAAPRRARLPARARGPGRGRPDLPRRPRGPGRVPRPPGRHRGIRPLDPR